MLTHRYDDALCLAAALHRSQRRKGTTIPYLSHLLAVSSLVLEHGGDEDQAIAGLLHDAIEDAGGAPTGQLVRDRFGDRVADMVLACSDTTDTQKAPWAARKRAYLASIPTKSPDALLVTCADKLHNATAILEDVRRDGLSVFERFNAGRDDTIWYYESLADALLQALPGAASARLSRIVAQLRSAA